MRGVQQAEANNLGKATQARVRKPTRVQAGWIAATIHTPLQVLPRMTTVTSVTGLSVSDDLAQLEVEADVAERTIQRGAVRRPAWLLFVERDDEGRLHPEDRIGLDIGVAGDEDMGGDRGVIGSAHHDMQMRRP